MNQTLSSRRDGSIDLAKALAICAVVFIHCSAGHFAQHAVGSFQWLANCFYGSVTRWAVAVFLLCSGALMNQPERELPLKKLFSRYLLRLALALAVWAALYELVRLYIDRGSAPLDQLVLRGVENWLNGTTYYHLYYLYYAIALYLALPMTRLIARHASESELRLILILWLLAGSVIPYLQYYQPFSQMERSLLRFILPAAFFVPGFGLLGWYLHRKPPKGWTEGLVLFLLGFGATFLGLWRRSAAAGSLDQVYLSGFAPFVLMMAAGVFRLCQCWAGPGASRGGRLSRPVRFLSQGSFCVYLIHPFFQGLAGREFFEANPPVWSVPAQVVLLLALSCASYAVLRKIPLVNRWLI